MSAEPPSPGSGLPPLAALPAPVRARILARAAEVLPQVTPLPASLRSVASFTPSRRARLGAGAIEAALADDGFRRSIGILVAAGGSSEAYDEVAGAWLLPETDHQDFEELLDRVHAPTQELIEGRAAQEADRLRERVSQLQAQLRAARAEAREEAAQLKSENSDLRRKLGAARQAVKVAGQAQTEAEEQLRAAEQREQSAATSSASQLRRLRAEVDQMRAAAGAQRKETRQGRQAAQVRARLLLDTLAEAAAGLRRELALPAVDGLPADGVVGGQLADWTQQSPGAARYRIDAAGLLEQHLTMPGAHLIVDGYNVSKTSWPTLALDAQRARLLRGVGPLASRSGAEVTVVFDAGATSARPTITPMRGVRVVFTDEGVIADDLIRKYVEAEPPGRMTLVVTDDRELGDDVRAAGARLVTTSALAGLVGNRP